LSPNKISSIGISVDSLVEETNLAIGRYHGKKTLDKEKLIALCRCIKDNGIKLKINHCISKYNEKEDISDFIETVNPDRFKIFQMSIVEGINGFCKSMQVSRKEFLDCCNKYLRLNPVIENDEEMKSSYLMVDSIGDFYTDRSNEPIGNTIKDDFKKLMNKASLDDASFIKRYIKLHN
jgi:radical S-adenosyl methionine domain-containing protein 2